MAEAAPTQDKKSQTQKKGPNLKLSLAKVDVSKKQAPSMPGDKSLGPPQPTKHDKVTRKSDAKVRSSQAAKLFESSLATHSPIA